MGVGNGIANLENYKDRLLPLLVQLEKRLSDQNQILDNTHDFLKADLIPALKNENDKTRHFILMELMFPHKTDIHTR